MFFTTESEIPFKSLKDVIRAYPDWKLMMKSGTDIYFRPYVSNDTDYKNFWNRVEKNPTESVYKSIAGVIHQHEKDSVVIHVSEADVDVYSKNERNDKLEVFHKGSSEYFNLIVPNNSPLGPILQHGTKVMFERGVFDYLKATNPIISKATESSRNVKILSKTKVNYS